MKKVIILLAFTFFACADDNNGGISCTEEYVPGLIVTVKEAETGEFLKEGVVVTATDGDYTEDLDAISDMSSNFYGVWERQGSYILSVYKEGYAEYTSDVIEVSADQCHVITEEVTVELQPE